MSILAWIVLGLIVNRSGEGFLLDIVLGIVGAVVGGLIMTALGGEGVSGFNLYSILVAIGGGVGAPQSGRRPALLAPRSSHAIRRAAAAESRLADRLYLKWSEFEPARST